MGIPGLIALFVLNHNAKAVISGVASGHHPPIVDRLDGRTLGHGYVHAPMQIFLSADGMYPPAVAAGHIAQPREIKGIPIRLPVAEGLLVHVVTVRLLTGGQVL